MEDESGERMMGNEVFDGMGKVVMECPLLALKGNPAGDRDSKLYHCLF